MSIVFCAECETELDESSSISIRDRKPCPNCSSMRRLFTVYILARVIPRTQLRFKGRHPRPGKPFIEVIQGSSFYRKAKIWMDLIQIVDRRNNRYKKIVKDPITDTIIRECDEPLINHQGFGSAKKK